MRCGVICVAYFIKDVSSMLISVSKTDLDVVETTNFITFFQTCNLKTSIHMDVFNLSGGTEYSF